RPSLSTLLALPIRTEMQACFELCRLQNGMGCWAVWLPTGEANSLFAPQPTYPDVQRLCRGCHFLRSGVSTYVPLCFGIKLLITTINDILDHDVERTRNCAIPRGAISVPRAWLFVAMQVILRVYLTKTTLSARDWFHDPMPVWPLYIIHPT
ncbi:hypothetical protein GGX14DRAFT_325635, partial [Mycena pura]